MLGRLTRSRAHSLDIDINQVIPTFLYALDEAKRHAKDMTTTNQDQDELDDQTDVNIALIESLQHSKFLELVSKRLIPFSGKIGNEIIIFFDEFESLAKATNVSESTKLSILPLFLDSYPRSLVNNLRTESYAEIKKLLIQQFQPPGHKERAILEFHERQQRENESIDEYLHNLRRMATRAYPSMSADDSKTQLKVSFLKGLLPRYRQQISFFGTPKTLEEAVERSKSIEYPTLDFTHANERQYCSAINSKKVETANEDTTTLVLIKNLTKTIDDLKVEMSQLKLNSSCNAVDFASKKSERPSQQQKYYEKSEHRKSFSRNHDQRQENSKSSEVCYECGKKGHYGRDCWHRKRRLEEQSRNHDQRREHRSSRSNSPENWRKDAGNKNKYRQRRESDSDDCPTFSANAAIYTQNGILKNFNSPIFINGRFQQNYDRKFYGMHAASYKYRQNHKLLQLNFSNNYDNYKLSEKPSSNRIKFEDNNDVKIDKCSTSSVQPNRKKYTNLPLIDTSVNDVPIRALIDCGSQITLIKKSFVENSLNISLPKVSNTDSGISVDGTKFQILATLPFSVKIGESLYEIPIGVVNRLPYPFLIGNDVIKNLEIDIIQSQGFLAIGQEKIEIVDNDRMTSCNATTAPENTDHAIVCFIKSIELPPMTECIVPCSVLSKQPNQEFLFEANNAYCDENKIFVASALVKSHDSITPCRILNANSKPITIEAGKIIGSATNKFEIQTKDDNIDSSTQNFEKEIENCVEKACITDREKIELKNILFENREIFAQNNRQLGKTTLISHKINTGNAKPVKGRKFRTPYAYREILKQTIDEMLDDNVIKPSKSEWSNPIFLVKKKDGSMRPVVDYRELNKITEPDVYPIPRIDEYLDSLGKATIFSTLDLKSGYWQIPMEESSKEKTAFSSPFGNFQFEVMPFGIRNAPSEFSRLMDIVLAGLQWKTALVYIDDIIIFARSFEEHKKNLIEVLNALKAANLKLKLSKCNFCQEKVTFLGHEISKNGVEPDRTKITSVTNHPAPKNQKELQKFLGLVQWFRRFVPSLAKTANPLYKLLQKNTIFEWREEEENAFQKLKTALTEAPILRFPSFEKEDEFQVITDASNTAIGSVLAQKNEKEQWIIAYASRQLNKAEINYSTTEKELLAVVWSIENFRHYLIGRQFTVQCDHKPLQWLAKTKDTHGRLKRWSLKLLEYDFVIKYIPGKMNEAADFLSRKTDSETMLAANVEIATPDDTKISDSQDADPEIFDIKQKLVDLTTKKMYRDEFEIIKNTLVRKYRPKNSGQNYLQTVVPKHMAKNILKNYHDDPLGGHLGVAKTLGKIQRKYWWIGMADDIENWCQSCDICNRRKPTYPGTIAPMQPIPVYGPWDTIAVDCLKMPTTPSGNCQIVVFMDYYTKWSEAFAVPNITAQTIANLLIDEIITRHGVPRRLLSDNGTNFTSNLIKDVCKILNVKKIFTTPYHAQTDGLVERFNRTIADILATIAVNDAINWDKYLNRALFAYRSSPQASTGESPFFLQHGREPNLPIDIIYAVQLSDSADVATYKNFLTETLGKVKEVVSERIKRAQNQQKRQYDKNSQNSIFKIGEIVFLKEENVDTVAKKLAFKYDGPYKIMKIFNIDDDFINCEISSLKSGETKRVHVNRLRKVPCKYTIDDGGFSLQTIIFARHNNQPFWPAEIVSAQILPRYLKKIFRQNPYAIPVKFFSQNERFAVIKDCDILPFQQNIDKFSLSKRKGMKQAIQLALNKLAERNVSQTADS